MRELWRRLLRALGLGPAPPVRWSGGLAQAAWAEPHPYPPEPVEMVEMTRAEYEAAMARRLARGEDFS